MVAVLEAVMHPSRRELDLSQSCVLRRRARAVSHDHSFLNCGNITLGRYNALPSLKEVTG